MKNKNSLFVYARAAVVAAGLAFAQPGHASEFGCKVLLCLAMPAPLGGPWSIPECVPDLKKLFHDLFKGHPFPVCDFQDGGDGKSQANIVYDYFDPCPDGMEPAPQSVKIAQGKSNPSNYLHGGLDLIGEPAFSNVQDDHNKPTGPRACVGPQIGTYLIRSGDSDESVYLYDSIVWQQPQNPTAIDVYRDDKFLQRVRW